MEFDSRYDGSILITNNNSLIGYFSIAECEKIIEDLKREVIQARQLQIETLKEELKTKLKEVDELRFIISTLESL